METGSETLARPTFPRETHPEGPQPDYIKGNRLEYSGEMVGVCVGGGGGGVGLNVCECVCVCVCVCVCECVYVWWCVRV